VPVRGAWSNLRVPLAPARRVAGQHGYGLLLVLIAVTAVYTVATPDTDGWHFGLVVLQASVALAAVWSADSRRPVKLLVEAIVAAALLVAVVSLIGEDGSQRSFSLITATLAALVPLIVVRGLIRTLRVEGASGHVIAGALSVYMLIGMLCSYIYGLIADIGDGPLFDAPHGDGSQADRLYYSYITQTTVGYGDFSPHEPAARAVAVLEALTGQLYLVTVVSLLVGGFIHQASRARETDQ
jgi:hypothetical protein